MDSDGFRANGHCRVTSKPLHGSVDPPHLAGLRGAISGNESLDLDSPLFSNVDLKVSFSYLKPGLGIENRLEPGLTS